MASIWTLQFQTFSFLTSTWVNKKSTPSYLLELRPELDFANPRLIWTRRLSATQKFVLRAVDASASSSGEEQSSKNEEVKNDTISLNVKDPVAKFQGMISSLPPIVFTMKRQVGYNMAIGLCVATAFFVMIVRVYMVRKSRYQRSGSVADLVRRGQLRSDRRGILKPLKYDDPFNNPLVKVSKNNSTVQMCGKVYRLAPVTLTDEQQAIHQKRRSRAYQWKRPTVFLKEGDPIPSDVDPDTVRWIPGNHPFATTTNDIDEDLAQNNVYQKHGVPFRIRAEHEALQRKLETLQSEQKLNKLTIDPSSAKDFERAFKSNSKSSELGEECNSNGNAGNTKSPSSPEEPQNSSGSTSSTDKMQKP